MGRTDKKILFGQFNIAHGADVTWDKYEQTLYDNSTGELNVTIDKFMADLSFLPGTISQYYYFFLFITDPSGSVPTGLDGANDATLQTWLNNYRKQIWMSSGGYAKFNEAIGDEEIRITSLEAATKRTLMPGQKLVLVACSKNASANASTSTLVYDMGLFYHY